MRRLVLFLVGCALVFAAGGVSVHAYEFNAPTDPVVSFTPAQLAKFWSSQAGARGVTSDSQWQAAMATLFATGTSPGVDPTALAFLRSFFVQIVHVGVP